MKNFLICCLCAAAVSVTKVISFGNVELLNADYIVVQCTFGYMEAINTQTLLEMVLAMFPFLLFQMFEGIEIYRHMCVGGMYYFYRCSNRKKWLFKETGVLAVKTAGFILIYYMAAVLTGMFFSRVEWSKAAVMLLAYCICMMALWLFLTTVVMNAIALFANSSVSFTVVAGVQLLFITLLSLFQEGRIFDIYTGTDAEKHIKLVKWNPMSHLVAAWHTGSGVMHLDILGNSNYGMSFYGTILAELLFAAFAVFVLFEAFDRMDLMGENRN